MSAYKCPSCGSEELYGIVTIEVVAPLAARSGSIKMGTISVSKPEIKRAWDYEGDVEKSTKGPIVCNSCESELEYHKGSDTVVQLS